MIKNNSSQRGSSKLDSFGFATLCVGVTILLALAGCQSRGGGPTVTGLKDYSVRRDIERGDRLLASQQYDDATLAFEEALSKDPNNACANARLGRIHAQNSNYERAVSYYRTALKSDPKCFHYALSFAQCQSRLASTSLDREKMMDAVARAYLYAQSLDPQEFTATSQLAMCYRELGDFGKALATLHEAAKQHPNAAMIHVQLGEIYHSKGDADHAVEEFKLALSRDPGNLSAHNGCGAVNASLAQNGGTKGSLARERAVAHFRRSLQINPNQPQVRGMLEQLEPYQWKAVTVSEDGPE